MALSDIAIVGYAETKIYDRSPRDVMELGAEVIESLLQQSGFAKDEIDGMIVGTAISGADDPFWSLSMADHQGFELDFLQSVDIGGSTILGSVARAAAAIDAGMCSTVLLLFTDTPATDFRMAGPRFEHEWTFPHGHIGPPAAFGLLTRRYEHQYGLAYEALAKLAVTQRDHAVLNDNACEKLRKPITVDDYMASRMIADPIRLLDSVMLCDGANGLLITSRKRAKEKGIARHVVPTGYGERIYYRSGENVTDITRSGHAVAGARAFAMAGLTPAEVASFHPYDDFIIAIMLQLEALGFCKEGQGCDFVRDTDFGLAGSLPLNTGGGQISAGQPGLAGGGVNFVEAVRQLLGEGGARQIGNRANALVTGIGGIPYGRNWGASTAMILQVGG